MSIPIILIISLFYYLAKGWAGNIVTGKIIYPAMLALTVLLLLKKNIETGKLISAKINFSALTIGIMALILYLYANLTGDIRRFETGITFYFGVFIFFLFFYFLHPDNRLNLKNLITLSLFLVSVEAIAEFVVVNILHMPRILLHYDEFTRQTIQGGLLQGVSDRAIGLLGNGSNTASFMVALFWLYRAFSPQGRLPGKFLSTLLGLGFLSCFSATGFAVLILTLSLHRKKNILWILGIVFFSIITATGLIQTQVFPFVNKLTLAYFSYISFFKWMEICNFFSLCYQHPSVIFFGSHSSLGWGNSDLAYVKVITDFGIAPLFLYAWLIRYVVVNFHSLPLPPHSLHFTKLFFWALVLGTFHYPVLFSFPVQALLGLLAALSYSMVSSQQKDPSKHCFKPIPSHAF